MAFSPIQLFLGAFLLITLLSGVVGHSYVTSPQSRSNQKQSESGCRGPACLGPCDVSLSARSASASVSSAKRGDQITIQWPRNNHAGGFIRFAWSKTADSDNAASFDNHVQQINCHEVGGCYPDDASNPNGGDSGPGDGSSRACSQNLTVPADLTDGQWTLQWSWFGGAFALGDYYSCVDYNIAGGLSGSTPTPVFVGGDFTYPGQQKCKFFNTDKLHVCVNEPCNAPIYPASQEESGPPAYVQVGVAIVDSSSAPTPTPAAPIPSTPSTTGANQQVPSTTGKQIPSTTGKQAAATTGQKNPSTTGKKTAPIQSTTGQSTTGHRGKSTTGQVASPVAPPPTVPVSSPSTPSPSSDTSCVLGNMKCLTSETYQTCSNGRDGTYWAAEQSCQTGLTCHPTGGFIYCY